MANVPLFYQSAVDSFNKAYTNTDPLLVLDGVSKLSQTFVELTQSLESCLLPELLQTVRNAILGTDLDLMFLTNIVANYPQFKTNLRNVFTFNLDLFCFSSAAVVGQVLGFHSI